MDPGALQGWYTDPLGRHEARYLSGGRLTALVRDGPVEGHDEPPVDAAWVAEPLDAPPPPRPAPPGPPAGRRRPPTRRVAAGAGAGLLALGLAGVLAAQGGGSGGTAPGGVAPGGLAAYRATVAAGSAHITSTVSVSVSGSAGGFASTSTGDFSWAHDEGTLTSTLAVPGPAGSGLALQSVFQGPVTWTRSDLHGAAAGALGDGWSETVVDGRPPPGSLLSGASPLSGQVPDPADTLGLLAERSTSVTLIGHDVLDGTPSTHLRARLPLVALIAGGAPAAQLQALQAALGSDHVDVDFWVDDAERLHQLGIQLTFQRDPDPPGPGGDTAQLVTYPLTLRLGLHLSAYGTPVYVSPPAPAQVTSVSRCHWSDSTLACDDSSGAVGTAVAGA